MNTVLFRTHFVRHGGFLMQKKPGIGAFLDALPRECENRNSHSGSFRFCCMLIADSQRRSMQYRTIPITLDMSASVPFHPFEVVDGDTGNVLDVTLTNDGEPMLLNGCTLCIAYSSSAGFAMQDEESGITIGSEAGRLTIQLDPTCYGPGNVSADIQIYSGPIREVLITSKRFDFRCRSTLISEAIIRANQAFPPLTSAAQDALSAAAAANEALELLAEYHGEPNVQSDWLENDSTSDAFIKHKPTIPSTPAAVGAASAEAFNAHAQRHASGGADAVSPASIGAEKQRVQFTDTTVAATAFVSDETYEDFPYRAALTLSGVTADMTPEVVFSVTDATAGSFAPVAECYDGGVYLYANDAPQAAVTIPTIICWKAVG